MEHRAKKMKNILAEDKFYKKSAIIRVNPRLKKGGKK